MSEKPINKAVENEQPDGSPEKPTAANLNKNLKYVIFGFIVVCVIYFLWYKNTKTKNEEDTSDDESSDEEDQFKSFNLKKELGEITKRRDYYVNSMKH